MYPSFCVEAKIKHFFSFKLYHATYILFSVVIILFLRNIKQHIMKTDYRKYLHRPTLLLNEEICKNNISSMKKKIWANNAKFRPHFKTHQSEEIGNWFKDEGVDKITVSSVAMAQYFANCGWNDITIAFPCNIHEVESINQLSKDININLLVESEETTRFLTANLKEKSGIFIKIDTGANRTGLSVDDLPEIQKIIEVCKESNFLNFKGLLNHAGHTYSVNGLIEISEVYMDGLKQLHYLRDALKSQTNEMILSTGDTPSARGLKHLGRIDEQRPGNFVFYDWKQYTSAVCSFEEIAVVLACPVVAVHQKRDEIIVHGGAVHLSKDSVFYNGKENFGVIVNLTSEGWSRPIEGAYVKSLSQEHGIIKFDKDKIMNYKPGDWLGIVPIHSCLTANLMKEYLTLSGEKISMMF